MHKGMMPYRNLLLMIVFSFLSMFILMYMMVNKYENVFINLNQFYMAGMMTAPMVIIEMFLMSSMYPKKIPNAFIVGISLFLLILFIVYMRMQTFIGDKEFLKSMIPHHAGAILMCEEASIKDPEIKKLCQSIISSQQSEIDWMKSKLNPSSTDSNPK